MEVKDIREKAHKVCSDYIGGAWKNSQPNDLVIEPVEGGFVNYLFKLSLPENCKTVCNEPRHLLMKNFSDNLNIGPYGIMVENIVVSLLSSKHLSPKIYGIFDGGRLDEYIEGRTLQSSDFNNHEILKEIVKKLALLHSLELPLNKDPNFIEQKLLGVFEPTLLSLTSETFKDSPEKSILYEKLMQLNPAEEIAWLKEIKAEVNSRVVFSHGDFHMKNMILKTNSDCRSDDRIRFVDYEICGYNYRAADLGRIMTNFCYDIIPDPPYFQLDWTHLPSKEKQKSILKMYLDEYQKLTNCLRNDEDDIDQLFKEVVTFNLLGHFFGIFFCLVNPFKMKKELNLIDYGDVMLKSYQLEKEKYLKSYQ